MNTPSNGGPAFPYAFQHEDSSHFTKQGFSPGMSLRAYLCAHAPPIPMGYLEQEMVDGPIDMGGGKVRVGRVPRDIPHPERHARWRMEYADAQIALLEGRTAPTSLTDQITT